MEDNRRDFIEKASATVASLTAFSGCVGEQQQEGIEQLYLNTDLEKAHREVNGHEINVNLMAYAEADSLEEMEIQYSEPGEDAWEVLSEDYAEDGEAHIQESFNGERKGSYRFRSVAYTGEEEFISEEEEVEFL